MSFQAVTCMTNRHRLCIGEITSIEAELAMSDNPAFDGSGVYLVKVDSDRPRSAGEVLAKFASVEAAMEVARFLSRKGEMEFA